MKTPQHTIDKIILPSDEAAAQYRTDIKGWVSREGVFFGDNEMGARYAGSTHTQCQTENCYNLTRSKHWLKCESCISAESLKKYNSFPHKEWDGSMPVCIYGGDEYFFNEEEIQFYLEEHDLKPEDLLLVYCTTNHYGPISLEYRSDVMHEDGEYPENLQSKLKEFNDFLNTLPPASYLPAKIKTTYIP